MAIGLLILLGEAAAAFLTLDLFFRYMAVEAIARRGLLYGTIGAWVTAVALLAALRTGGFPGAAVAAPGPAIWWMLWRFGMRKQFTYLYKDDGGRPVNTQKPDP